MLRFVCGKTGGGKTQFAVAELIKVLVTSDKVIVTNLALRLHPWVRMVKGKRGKAVGVPQRGLLAVLRERYGSDFDAERRITFISTEDDLRRFYAVRPILTDEGVRVERVPLQEEREPKDRRFVFDGAKYPGVSYFIDELHEYLPASGWKATEGETQSWASQNRRAGDDAWCLTQAPELVALAFRRQSLECYQMVNHAYRRIGVLRHPDVIRYGVFLNTPPKDSEVKLHGGSLDFPKGDLWESYDTASGASVTGGAADIGANAGGLPWWFSIVFAVGILVFVSLSFVGCHAGLTKALQRTVPGVPVGRPVPAVVRSPALSVAPEPVRGNPLAMIRAAQSEPAVIPFYSWGVSGGLYVVETADGPVFGSKFASQPGGLIELDGVRYKHARRPKSDQK